MIILGIDPGTERAGYGVIETRGSSLVLHDAGILKVGKARGADALFAIKRELDALFEKYTPDILATEKLYFSKNQKTALQIAEARGVILLAGKEHGVSIKEFAPNEVKIAVTGYGAADKRAVLKMVRLILKSPDLALIDDASDALAIAIAASRR